MPARMRWQENPRAAGFRVHCVSRTTLKAGVGLRNPLEAELADGRQALFAPSKRAGGLGAAALTRPARHLGSHTPGQAPISGRRRSFSPLGPASSHIVSSHRLELGGTHQDRRRFLGRNGVSRQSAPLASIYK
jgi:hypothetical protein